MKSPNDVAQPDDVRKTRLETPGPLASGIRSKLKTVSDNDLKTAVEVLINAAQSQLRGEYQLYCVYQNEETDAVYSLVYSFYVENDSIAVDKMSDITSEDGRFLHGQLKKSGLPLDYFFIVPYFDSLDGDSVMTGAVVTQDFD